MGPDWLGSPQHFVAGALMAAAIVVVARRWVALVGACLTLVVLRRRHAV